MSPILAEYFWPTIISIVRWICLIDVQNWHQLQYSYLRGKRGYIASRGSSFCPQILLWHTPPPTLGCQLCVPLWLSVSAEPYFCSLFVPSPHGPTVHVVLSPACQISKTKLANAQLARALHLNVQNPYFLTFLLRLYISFIFQVCEDYWDCKKMRMS